MMKNTNNTMRSNMIFPMVNLFLVNAGVDEQQSVESDLDNAEVLRTQVISLQDQVEEMKKELDDMSTELKTAYGVMEKFCCFFFFSIGCCFLYLVLNRIMYNELFSSIRSKVFLAVFGNDEQIVKNKTSTLYYYINTFLSIALIVTFCVMIYQYKAISRMPGERKEFLQAKNNK